MKQQGWTFLGLYVANERLGDQSVPRSIGKAAERIGADRPEAVVLVVRCFLSTLFPVPCPRRFRRLTESSRTGRQREALLYRAGVCCERFPDVPLWPLADPPPSVAASSLRRLLFDLAPLSPLFIPYPLRPLRRFASPRANQDWPSNDTGRLRRASRGREGGLAAERSGGAAGVDGEGEGDVGKCCCTIYTALRDDKRGRGERKEGNKINRGCCSGSPSWYRCTRGRRAPFGSGPSIFERSR